VISRMAEEVKCVDCINIVNAKEDRERKIQTKVQNVDEAPVKY
jgi:hypothetical protein